MLTRRHFLASPAALAAQTRRPLVVAVCKGNGTVALLDPQSLEVAARIPTGEGPHEVCVAGPHAYVGLYGIAGKPGHELAILSLEERKELRRVNLLPLRAPHGLITAGNFIYFSAEQSRAVGRYNPATHRVDWSMGTGQALTHMLVATPDHRKLYATNILDNTVSAIEITAARGVPRLTQIRTGERPEGIAITPDGREVWAGHNTDGQISIIDTATDQVKQTIPASKMAFRLAFTPDGKTCVVAGGTGQEVVLIDAATRVITARIPTPNAVPQGILLSPDGLWLYVATGPALLKLDIAQRKLAGECQPGPGVDGLAWYGG